MTNLSLDALREDVCVTEVIVEQVGCCSAEEIGRLVTQAVCGDAVALWADTHGPFCIARYLTEDEYPDG